MKFSQKDSLDIASLMYENYQDEEMDMDMDMDMDMGDDLGDGDEMVMEIDPIAPVEPSMGREESDKVLVANLKKLAEYSQRLNDMVGEAEFKSWMVAKIVKASDYVDEVWHMLDASEADFANTGFEQAGDEQDLGF